MNTTSSRKPAIAACTLILAASFVCTQTAIGQITPPSLPASQASMLVPEELVVTDGEVFVPPGADPVYPNGIRAGYKLVEGCIAVPDTGGYSDRSYQPGTAWPGGYVPFEFGPSVTEANRTLMRQAMWLISQTNANINFVERSNGETPYVWVTNNAASGTAGTSYGVGISNSGANEIGIASGYWDNTFVVVHELMHRLGFHHEQGRPDRDQYVTILWNNITAGQSSQFDIHPFDDMLGTPYDYLSIMHYSACAFTNCSSCSSSNASCRTITTANASAQSLIGNSSNWGLYDRADLEALYGTGSCAYVSPNSPGIGSLDAPAPNLQVGATMAAGGTVWCNRGPTPYATGGLLLTPATYRPHGNGPTLTFGR
ncbi:MAG: M12 family metallopeptidase [Planctomycetota bacterium]|nr:M12 family metallopeptidase [Planctomycetota bacterium]